MLVDLYQVPDMLISFLIIMSERQICKKTMEGNYNYPNQVVLDFFKAKAAAYISPMGVKAMLNRGTRDIVLVDVRHPSLELTWRIPGSLAIPATTMSDHFSDI